MTSHWIKFHCKLEGMATCDVAFIVSTAPSPPLCFAVREGNRMQDLPPNCHSPLVLLYYPLNTHVLPPIAEACVLMSRAF